jgi:hypothetical protein
VHHVALFTLLALGSLSCTHTTTLPSLGTLRPETLCSDVKRCDVRGDVAVSTLNGSKAVPIHLAAGQGPESYLGKVAPKRIANSVLKTCGGDVTRDDWLETGPAARTLELTDQGRQQFRASIRAHLAEALLAHPEVLNEQTSIDATVDAAASGLGVTKVGLLSQTYWLKDASFEKRLGQCGEENYADIIYSLTLLRLSDLTQKELESKLVIGLEAKLPMVATSASAEPVEHAEPLDLLLAPAAKRPLASAAAVPAVDPVSAHHALLRELAFGTVQALASELRTIAALGFDEP